MARYVTTGEPPELCPDVLSTAIVAAHDSVFMPTILYS
jgi:hypothetical protein